MVVRLGGYARISLDKDGEELGVERQRMDYMQAAAARPGWLVAEHYVDNDLSAWKRNVKRPEFERLVSDLESGAIDGVITYDLDRFTRQPRELERLVDLYEANPKLVFATIVGDIDLSSSDGRTMARVMVAFANKASADTGRRVARKHRELADNGKNGGGFPAFGWKEDRITVDPTQAALITKAHEDLLAGSRLATIVREWQAKGVQTSRGTGSPISRTAVKTILRNPRLAGFRAVKGQIHYGTDGQPVRGEWEPICAPDRLEAVSAVLDGISDRYKGRTKNGTNAYRYLLTGILRCALCGTRMLPNARSSWSEGSKGSAFTYRCPVVSDGGCGKVARAGEPVDAHVVNLIHEAEGRLSAPPEADKIWTGESRLAEAEQERSELLAAKAAKKISMGTLIALLEPLEAELEELKRDRAAHAVKVAQAANPSLIEEFERLPLERQRAVIMKHVKAVMVSPAGRGARKFNPDLLEVVWAA
ncbi:recombinase family protein [Streptomyces sp. NPDC058290]|uniref:recombinase family protein n=1 Tax=Streptomyces sp. NPDC058290 TaxID=3346426 RepID=UPI0036E23E3E